MSLYTHTHTPHRLSHYSLNWPTNCSNWSCQTLTALHHGGTEEQPADLHSFTRSHSPWGVWGSIRVTVCVLLMCGCRRRLSRPLFLLFSSCHEMTLWHLRTSADGGARWHHCASGFDDHSAAEEGDSRGATPCKLAAYISARENWRRQPHLQEETPTITCAEAFKWLPQPQKQAIINVYQCINMLRGDQRRSLPYNCLGRKPSEYDNQFSSARMLANSKLRLCAKTCVDKTSMKASVPTNFSFTCVISPHLKQPSEARRSPWNMIRSDIKLAICELD